MTHMTDELLLKLRKVFDNPAEYFIDYPILIDPNDEQEKRFDAALSEIQKSHDMKLDLQRVEILPEFIGLIASLDAISDLAYEIANAIPNNKDKEIAIGLLESTCQFIVKACKPEVEDE